MSSARETVEAYFEARTNQDFVSVRSLLADGLSFRGPYDAFDSADDFVSAVSELWGLVKGVEVRKVFDDGDDVMVVYDLVPQKAVDNVTLAEWYHIGDGTIDSIRLIFDKVAFSAIFPD